MNNDTLSTSPWPVTEYSSEDWPEEDDLNDDRADFAYGVFFPPGTPNPFVNYPPLENLAVSPGYTIFPPGYCTPSSPSGSSLTWSEQNKHEAVMTAVAEATRAGNPTSESISPSSENKLEKATSIMSITSISHFQEDIKRNQLDDDNGTVVIESGGKKSAECVMDMMEGENTWRTGDGARGEHDGQASNDLSAVPTSTQRSTHAQKSVSVQQLLVKGVIRVGHMRSNRNTFQTYRDSDIRKILTAASTGVDMQIEGEGDAELTIVDADTHDWPQKPGQEELAAFLTAVHPVPDAAWASHGAGLKLVYVGPFHEDRALAAALCLPQGFTVEIIRHTRHPLSTSTSHPGKKCGSVIYGHDDPAQAFKFAAVGKLTTELREQALEKLSMDAGCRYNHDRCLIDPDSGSVATECVVVLDQGVFCHRCKAQDQHFRQDQSLPAGYTPFSLVVGSSTTFFEALAHNLVHWTHGRLVLMHHYPKLSENILELAYHKTLVARCGKDDPRICQVFNANLDFVWSKVGWLEARTFNPTKVDRDAADSLPYVQYVQRDDTKRKVRIDKSRRSRVINRQPVGYVPIHPIRGIYLGTDTDSIPVVVSGTNKHAIRLLTDPMGENDAFKAIAAAFPKLCPNYLKACLAGMICAQRGSGQPPMLVCTGPAGSGKGETVRLAASFLGDVAPKLQLSDDPEAFIRSIGVLLASGHHSLVLDEMGKVRKLIEKINALLQVGRDITWRLLHCSQQITSHCDAAFFFPCVSFPDFLKNSVEFCRRTRHIRLHFRTPNWAETSGGDTIKWRDRNPSNAEAANSLLTHVYRLCQEHRFNFIAVAERLGLGSLGENEGGVDPEVFKKLYRYARNECGQRKLIQDCPSFKKGWVDLNASEAKKLIDIIVALDEPDDIKHARAIAKRNLEAVACNDVLGITEVLIRCNIKIHGTRWALRFEADERVKKGNERINEDLPALQDLGPAQTHEPDSTTTPPADGLSAGGPVDDAVAMAIKPQCSIDPSSRPADLQTAQEALRKAGFPL